MDRSRMLFSVLLVALVAVVALPLSGQAQTAYFVVADPTLYPFGIGDSYILPLTEAADITLARQIVQGGGFAIVIATVTVGSDGINRDWLAPGQPLWSWHVSSFDSFADLAAEVCDGNPTFTEVSAQNLPDGSELQICYWTYTVVEEIDDSVSTEVSTWGSIKSLFR